MKLSKEDVQELRNAVSKIRTLIERPVKNTPRERYEIIRQYLIKTTNMHPELPILASAAASEIREEWRGRYLMEALFIIEELLELT